MDSRSTFAYISNKEEEEEFYLQTNKRVRSDSVYPLSLRRLRPARSLQSQHEAGSCLQLGIARYQLSERRAAVGLPDALHPRGKEPRRHAVRVLRVQSRAQHPRGGAQAFQVWILEAFRDGAQARIWQPFHVFFERIGERNRGPILRTEAPVLLWVRDAARAGPFERIFCSGSRAEEGKKSASPRKKTNRLVPRSGRNRTSARR